MNVRKAKSLSPTQHRVMRGRMYGKTSVSKRRGRGRRNPGREITRTGWNAPIRTKVSKYAGEFAFEVRLRHEPTYGLPDEALPHQELIDQMRQSSDCRIVGLHPHRGTHRPRRRMASVRLLFRREQDLLQLRLITNEVFRIYRLIAPESADASS